MLYHPEWPRRKAIFKTVATNRDAAGDLRWLFQNDVNVGAAKAECIDAGAPRQSTSRLERLRRRWNVEAGTIKSEIAARCLKPSLWWEDFVIEHHHRTNQTCHSGGRQSMAHVSFDGRHRATKAAVAV